jgi:assimilatory nitrate reductase catalytic subunit
MGSRLFSNTTSLLGGHDFANPGHRVKVARLLGIPEERIPDRPSWAYDQILDGIRDGRIRGLWIIGTNPAHSWIDQGGLRDVLGRLDFLVVQDMYHSTETARLADLVLPAAGWGEKEGTFINSERRIGLIKKVRRAPGQALSDFHIFRLVAHYYGCGPMFARWDSPEAVFQILKALTAGQPCDINGIADYRILDETGGIQWPFPAEGADRAPQRRLFADGRFYFPDGRARFHFGEPRPMPELPARDFPFHLLTGRGSAAQWHTQTRTAKSDILRKLSPQAPYIEINPFDARSLGLRPGQWAVVESPRGQARVRALVTPTVPEGQLFLPMHDESTNRLTVAVFDPSSRQPAYKGCAVRVRAVEPEEPASGTPLGALFPQTTTMGSLLQ